MTQKQKYKQFRFEKYHFNYDTWQLTLHYSYDGKRHYTEKITFSPPENDSAEVNRKVVDALSFYVFMIAGSSYYKSFVASEMVLVDGTVDYWQADFFNMIYSGGLSQFVYENGLSPDNIAKLSGSEQPLGHAIDYDGAGALLMQSGGRDSLLSAELMKHKGNEFTSWHMSSTGGYPSVIDEVGNPVVVSKREIDLDAIKEDLADGGLNGHVPFSAMYAGFALIQAAICHKNIVIASNESSADQANVSIDGYDINHQFSKTFAVEQAIEEYLRRYVSEDIHYGSILRPFNELQIAKLFAIHAWPKYRLSYSSCNLANYKQGEEGEELTWDGNCPKCANAFLTMTPYVAKDELLEVFAGKNLLRDDELTLTYKQLLGLEDIKPFECVGSFEELQQAYNLAVAKDSDYKNPDIDTTDDVVDLSSLSPYQEFFDEFLDYKKLV